MLMSCGGSKSDKNTSLETDNDEQTAVEERQSDTIPMKIIQANGKSYNVADVKDEAVIYKDATNKANLMFVISKKEFRLYVYENKKLIAHFPVCYGKNPAAKTRQGDMATPECTEDNPFSISEIKDASTWCHDFGDGRGNIPSYGHWFMRLLLNGSLADNHSIGIHGSTNNAESVPGRDSEGCIRLRDADIMTLHDKYAEIGTPVIVKGKDIDKYDWEKAAEEELGDKYVAQK